MSKTCVLCGSDQQLTFHHLIPRSCHSNKWFRKRFDKAEMKARGIDICRKCHYFVHDSFDEKTLGREYNTLDALLESDIIRNYVRWARKRR